MRMLGWSYLYQTIPGLSVCIEQTSSPSQSQLEEPPSPLLQAEDMAARGVAEWTPVASPLKGLVSV